MSALDIVADMRRTLAEAHECTEDECAHVCWYDGGVSVKPLGDGETWCDCTEHESESEKRYAYGDR